MFFITLGRSTQNCNSQCRFNCSIRVQIIAFLSIANINWQASKLGACFMGHPVHTYVQGCGVGVGVETGVGVGRSLSFWLESESELGSAKFVRLRLRPGVTGYPPPTDADFGGTVLPKTFKVRKKRRSAVRR